MSIKYLVVALGLGISLSASAPVQAQTCNATVSVRSVVLSESQESTWDIVFDIAATSCDASRGDFDYVVDLKASGRTEKVTRSAEFRTEKGQRTAIRESYQAPSGLTVSSVGGIVVRCTCVGRKR